MKNNGLPGQGFAQSKSTSAEIIPFSLGLINGKAALVADARKLHGFLGNGERFSSWIKKRIEQYKFVENVDYETFSESTEKGRPRIEYRVSSDMAKELSMVERSERGKEARQYFIECEERLRFIAPAEAKAAQENWRKKRVAACDEHKVMGDAMKGYIERTGDNQHGFAYSNECTFLNGLVLGIHPRTWAKQNGIPAKQVRDHMNADQLALLAYLESRDCALLDMDMTTAERKERLTELAQRRLAKHLVA